MNTYQLIKDCQQRMLTLQEAIPSKVHSMRIAEIDELMTRPEAWNDNRKAAALLKERRVLEALVNRLSSLSDEAMLLVDYADSFPEEIEQLAEQSTSLYESIVGFELSQTFKKQEDGCAALIKISAGAGGTEAANWVNILLRMYLRFADANGYKTEVLDLKPSEENSAICIDSVVFRVEGDYAYGYLKSENGVHRLIRNSPFNANNARQTSFAAVEVTPDIEDEIDIQINENDLETQATRSGGAGGQAVNKISSCIIMKHLPTGIMIRSQTERSQHENRRIALKLLKAKLYELEIKKKEAEQDAKLNAQQDNSFGHQIRTYTMSPQALVKDHRTKYEIKDAEIVLNGNIKEFLSAYLRYSQLDAASTLQLSSH